MNGTAHRAILFVVASMTLLLGGSLLACRRHVVETPQSVTEPFAVLADISTNRIYIGDPVILRLRIRHPQDAVIHPPSLSQSTVLLVRNEKRSTRSVGKGQAETEIAWEITSFTLGQHELTNHVVTCKLSDGTTLEKTIPPQWIWVESVLNETNATLRPPRDLVDWPTRVPRWIWVLPLIAATAAVIGWIIARLLSKPRTILQSPPPESAHEIALRALRALKAKGWIEQANAEPFYVELSDIVRKYIENRFGIRAPELTTEEFIHEAARSRDLTPAQQELIKNFLEQADLVKFARFHPSPKEMNSAYEAAERLVQETIPTHPSRETGTEDP